MIFTSLNSLENKPVIDWTKTLPVNKVKDWLALTGGPRDPNAITTIVLHHDAIKKSQSAHLTDLELATNIANSHINLKSNEPTGDGGFPYHVWIRNGNAYVCNDLLTYTYGVASHNSYTVHVSVSGEYKYTDALTDDDRNVLLGVVNTLMHMNELPNMKTIKGHGELNPTACPGYDVARIKREVVDQWVMYEASQTLEARRGNAYLVTQQTQFMYSKVKEGGGSEQWALHFFDKFMKLMQEEGWFK